MPKGYWIAHAEIEDLDEYKKYQEANAPCLQKIWGEILSTRRSTRDKRR